MAAPASPRARPRRAREDDVEKVERRGGDRGPRERPVHRGRVGQLRPRHELALNHREHRGQRHERVRRRDRIARRGPGADRRERAHDRDALLVARRGRDAGSEREHDAARRERRAVARIDRGGPHGARKRDNKRLPERAAGSLAACTRHAAGHDAARIHNQVTAARASTPRTGARATYAPGGVPSSAAAAPRSPRSAASPMTGSASLMSGRQ